MQRVKRAAVSAVAAAMIAASAGAAQTHKTISDNDPDLVEIRQYRLTMDKVQRMADAMQEFNKMLAANPALKKRMNEDGDNDGTIAEKAHELEVKSPEAVAVLRSHGLSPREYIVVSLAFMNDVMIVGMKKQGAIKEYPPKAITAENAAFVEANFDKLQEISAKLSAPDDQN